MSRFHYRCIDINTPIQEMQKHLNKQGKCRFDVGTSVSTLQHIDSIVKVVYLADSKGLTLSRF